MSNKPSNVRHGVRIRDLPSHVNLKPVGVLAARALHRPVAQPTGPALGRSDLEGTKRLFRDAAIRWNSLSFHRWIEAELEEQCPADLPEQLPAVARGTCPEFSGFRLDHNFLLASGARKRKRELRKGQLAIR
jgi:hypothetical protein